MPTVGATEGRWLTCQRPVGTKCHNKIFFFYIDFFIHIFDIFSGRWQETTDGPGSRAAGPSRRAAPKGPEECDQRGGQRQAAVARTQDSGHFDRCGGGSTPSFADEGAELGGPDSDAGSGAPIPEGLKPPYRRLPESVHLIPHPSRSLTGGTQHAGAGLEEIRDPRRSPRNTADWHSEGSRVRRGAPADQGSGPIRRRDERRGSGFRRSGDADRT